METQALHPKYSVIIPVYNAEKTLYRCLNSLLPEDDLYTDSEIILVNDGSTDGSLAICREYAEKYHNIRVIDKPNGGVSTARNAGLDEARGRYILFVDSDDYVETGFFSIIDGLLKAYSADLVKFSGSVDNGAQKRTYPRKPIKAGSREELFPFIIDLMCSKSINGPWAKLYRRDIIEDHCIRFPEGASIGEDRAFNIVYSFYIRSYMASERAVYVLNTENGESLSRKRRDDLQKQFNIANEYIDRELITAPVSEEEKKGYREALDYDICTGIYHDAKLMIKDDVCWFTRQKRLRLLCKEINKKHMKYPKTRYCTLITLPIRLYLTPVIDAMAWKLSKDS